LFDRSSYPSYIQLTLWTSAPISHTCGPKLEVPTTYESYADVASEFKNILKDEQAWSFDII
jgi:hypothetical protein